MKGKVLALFAFAAVMLLIQTPMEMLVTAKIAFLIASIIQFVIAALLLCGGYIFYHKKIKRHKNRYFWKCVVCLMLILGVFFLIGCIVTMMHFFKVVELGHEVWRTAI